MMKYFFCTTLIGLLFTSFSYSQNTLTITDTLGLDSLQQVFYKNGNLFYQVPYRNGSQNGWYEQYHENGLISHKEFRVNGKTVDGFYIYLNDQGEVYEKGMIKDGCRIGKWRLYMKGEPFKIYHYKRNGVLKKVQVWSIEKQKWINTNL